MTSRLGLGLPQEPCSLRFLPPCLSKPGRGAGGGGARGLPPPPPGEPSPFCAGFRSSPGSGLHRFRGRRSSQIKNVVLSVTWGVPGAAGQPPFTPGASEATRKLVAQFPLRPPARPWPRPESARQAECLTCITWLG